MKALMTTRFHLLRPVMTVVIVFMLLALGWSVLLASAELGLAHGEFRSAVPPQQVNRLGHASSLGLVIFVLVQLAIGSTLGASGTPSALHVRWPWIVVGTAVVGTLVCYGLVRTTLYLGGAPDPIIDGSHLLSEWLVEAARVIAP